MCTMMMMMIFTSKSGVDEHFPEVVWVAGQGEQAVSDETLPGAENKVLLDICGVVEPDTQDVHSQYHSQLTGGGLVILKIMRIEPNKVNKYIEILIRDVRPDWLSGTRCCSRSRDPSR